MANKDLGDYFSLEDLDIMCAALADIDDIKNYDANIKIKNYRFGKDCFEKFKNDGYYDVKHNMFFEEKIYYVGKAEREYKAYFKVDTYLQCKNCGRGRSADAKCTCGDRQNIKQMYDIEDNYGAKYRFKKINFMDQVTYMVDPDDPYNSNELTHVRLSYTQFIRKLNTKLDSFVYCTEVRTTETEPEPETPTITKIDEQKISEIINMKKKAIGTNHTLKEEAILRLRLLHVKEQDIQSFIDKSIVPRSFTSEWMDRFGADAQKVYEEYAAKTIGGIQAKYGCLVYYGMANYSDLGLGEQCHISFLIATRSKDTWRDERNDLKDENMANIANAYVLNIDDKNLSEFGSIYIKKYNGLVYRSYTNGLSFF